MTLVNSAYTDDAVLINGRFIEELLPGFITIETSGREMLPPTAEERTITVSFFLDGDNIVSLRNKAALLNTILSGEESRFMFNDEPDKYYMGRAIAQTEVENRQDSFYGQYQIQCSDIFKYSTAETTKTAVADPDGTGMVFNLTGEDEYDGGYKCYPTFEVDFAEDESASGTVGTMADCGYVLFSKGDYSIQAGDDTEEDTGSMTVLNHAFTSANKGGFGDEVLTIPNFNCIGTSAVNSNGLYASAFGSGSGFHGVAVSKAVSLPSDFTVSYNANVKLSTATKTAKKQNGLNGVLLMAPNNSIVYGLMVKKTSTTNVNGFCEHYKGNTVVRTDSNIPIKSWENKTITLTRKGTMLYVSVPHLSSQLSFDVGTIAVAKIVFLFGKNGTVSTISTNFIKSVKAIDGNVNITNTFGSGDKLTMDCVNMAITKNGQPADDLGDITNDWEHMFLDVGENQIGVQYSPWLDDAQHSAYKPVVKMKYRKRWL